MVVSNWDNQTAGEAFFSNGTIEEIGEISLEKGKSYTLKVEFKNEMLLPPPDGVAPIKSGGFRLGAAEKIDEQESISRAETLASQSDYVILVAGLSGDWEAEAFDRPTMDLPGSSNELIERVVKANPNAVVVLQTGTPVHLPFLEDTKTLVQSWYGGNEGGYAVGDVIFGEVAPSGRMSLSWPRRVEDNPSWVNWGSENGKVCCLFFVCVYCFSFGGLFFMSVMTEFSTIQVYYGEGVFVGYRWYEETKRDVAIAFGEGKSYTTFEWTDVKVSGTVGEQSDVKVEVTVKNTGSVASKDVVQVYLKVRLFDIFPRQLSFFVHYIREIDAPPPPNSTSNPSFACRPKRL